MSTIEEKVAKLEKENKSLKEKIAGLTKKVDQQSTDTQVGDIKFAGGAFDFLSEGKITMDAFRDSVINTGTLLEPNGKLFSNIAGFGENAVKLFGDIRPGIQAVKDLQDGLRIFSQVGEESRSGLTNLAMRFKTLGVNMGNLTSILDSTVIGFGKNTADAKALAEQVGAVGNATGVGMREAVKNFAFAQTRMAYSSAQMLANFKGLQATAAQTGISFQSLTSVFGDNMDTFEGSARKAGDLNAILGKSVFNSVDLLGQTESERINTIVQGIRESVNVQALTKNKFQLKAVANGLGLSVDETRRLLSGQMSVDDALKKKAKEDPRQKAMRRMANLLQDNVNPGLEQFDYLIRRTRSVFDNMAVAANRAQREAVQNLIANVTGSERVSPSDFYRTMNEFGEFALQGGMSVDQFKKNVLKLAKVLPKITDPKEQKKAKDMLEDLKTKSATIGDPRAPTAADMARFGDYNVASKQLSKNIQIGIGKGLEALFKGLTSDGLFTLEKVEVKLGEGPNNSFTGKVQKIVKKMKQ